MVSLKSVGRRFEIMFRVIQGGTGVVTGVLSETDQNAQPAYVFIQPRHVLRTDARTALKVGMVLRTEAGSIFMVGNNGPSESRGDILFQSFRLFEPTGQYKWERRRKVMDPIARVERDDGVALQGMIYCAIEALDREVQDPRLKHSFEQSRFITGAAVKSDDLIDNRPITKVDKQLGLQIGILT